jgi:hypothetical protein
MTGEEYRQEQQKIYDELVNTCIQNTVKGTDFGGSHATIYYENTYVTVSEDTHMFTVVRTNGGRVFNSEKIKLDPDFHDFVWETAKLDRERKDALAKVEQELRNRKERVISIKRLKSFAEDFKKAI